MKNASIETIKQINRGLKLIQDGAFNNAFDALKLALEQTESATPLQRSVAERMLLCTSKLNDIDRAIALLKDLIQQDSQNDYYLSYLGSLYVTLEDPEPAIVYLTLGKKLSGKNKRIFDNDLSRAYAMKGDFKKAIVHFESALASENYLLSGYGSTVVEEIAKRSETIGTIKTNTPYVRLQSSSATTGLKETTIH